MTKEFKKGDKVYWVNEERGNNEDRIVKSVEDTKVRFTNGGWMPIDKVFHLDEVNNEESVKDNPFKKIKVPIYTLDTISEACFDYMSIKKVGSANDFTLRSNAHLGIIYYPAWHRVAYKVMERGVDDARTKLSKEEFYKAIGFTESNDKVVKKVNIPLFGNDLINKYRK